MRKKGFIFGGIGAVVLIAIIAYTYYATTKSLAVECKIKN